MMWRLKHLRCNKKLGLALIGLGVILLFCFAPFWFLLVFVSALLIVFGIILCSIR